MRAILKRVLVFFAAVALVGILIPNEVGAVMKFDNTTQTPTGWSSTKEDNTIVVGFTDSVVDVSKIYGIRVTLRSNDDYLNGCFAVRSEDGSDIFVGSYGTDDGLKIKKESDGKYSFTYSDSNLIFGKNAKSGEITLEQWWPDAEKEDVEIYNIELLDKSEKVLSKLRVPTLSNTSATVYIGSPLKLEMKNTSDKASWSTSNKKVATVKNGTVTGLKPGTAKITAKCGGKKYICTVTVKKAGFVDETISMAKGASAVLEIGGAKPTSFSSSNKKAVAVNAKTGKITAKKANANVTITAKASNGKKYTCKIKTFDQKKIFSPDYRGINTKNYLSKLNEKKKKIDAILKCDRIVFFLNYFNDKTGVVDGGSPKEIDVNLIDQISGKVSFEVDYKTVPGAEWYEMLFFNNWDQSTTEKYFQKTSTEITQKNTMQTYYYTMDDDLSDYVRKSGRLWIGGNGFCVNSISISGKPVNSYKGITATKNSPVVKNGQLHVDGAYVLNDNNERFRMLGAAFAWNQGHLEYANSTTYAYFNKEWGGNSVRIGQHAETEDGFASETGNKDLIIYYIEEMIDSCIDAGMYAVVDWHCFNNPLTYSDDAVKFFEIISEKYANIPNVIYEICNEPCDDDSTPEKDDSWDNIKEYADKVIPVIRKNSPNAVIICGGEFYSNDLRSRIDDPLKYENIVYTDHIYPDHVWQIYTMEDYKLGDVDTLLEYEKKAVEKGLALAITETNISIDDSEISELERVRMANFEEFWKKESIGIFYWGIDNDEAGSSGLKPGLVGRYGWKESDYTESGKSMYHQMRKAAGLEPD